MLMPVTAWISRFNPLEVGAFVETCYNSRKRVHNCSVSIPSKWGRSLRLGILLFTFIAVYGFNPLEVGAFVETVRVQDDPH